MGRKIQEIAESALGTCNTIDEVLEEFGTNILEISAEDWKIFSNITFKCETCGWWCEAQDLEDYEEQTCKDCRDFD